MGIPDTLSHTLAQRSLKLKSIWGQVSSTIAATRRANEIEDLLKHMAKIRLALENQSPS